MRELLQRFQVIRPLVAVLLVVGLGSASPAPKSAEPEAIEVPFEMLPSNHMVVEVELNEEGPYRLIFDLGSPITLISSKAAKETGMIGNVSALALLFSTQQSHEIEAMTIGELTAEEVPVMVMDHPVVGALGRMLGKPIDGLVGHSFFARYKTTINYKTKKMTFTPVDAEVRDFFTELPNRMMSRDKVAERIVLEPAGLFGIVLEEEEPEAEDQESVILIKSVLENSPAALAGLKAGDQLKELDGRWTTSIADVYYAASKVDLMKTVPVIVIRDGEEIPFSMTVRPGI